MSWYQTFNDVFWISIATLSFSFFGVVIKSMLQSKCDNVDVCYGLLKIHRRVELETDNQSNNQSNTQPTSQV